MSKLIEVIIEDKETGNRIIVATFQKSICTQDHFSNDLAKELLAFLSKHTGQPMGEQKTLGTFQRDISDVVFFPQPLNEKPSELPIKKVHIE
jgi:hypothetical protein